MKSNILLFAKIGGGILGSGVSLLTTAGLMMQTNPIEIPIEDTIPEAVTETQIEEKQEETKEESGQGETQQETPASNSQHQVADTQPKEQATQPAMQTQPKAQTQTQPKTQTQPAQTEYSSGYDFEHAMLGVCPQNVPAGVWPNSLRPIVSLGYRPEEKYGPFSAETAVAVWWSSYKQGMNSPSYIATVIGGNQIDGNSCGQGTNDTLFKMNYNTLTVYWEDNAITPNGKEWADQQAQYMTSFLQSISAQFKAKCGY